jgi:predicted enzyme related to lactoylglutathione lyase
MSDTREGVSIPEWPVFVGVTIDAADPQRIADFWSTLLEVEIEEVDEDEIRLARQPKRGVGVAVQRVAAPTPGKNRIHLDLLVRDLPTAAARAIALGGLPLDRHQRDGYRWQIIADPEGNQFCLVQPPME